MPYGARIGRIPRESQIASHICCTSQSSLARFSAGSPLNTRVLERMLQPRIKVRHKLRDTPLIRHIPRNALSDLDRIGLAKVPRRRSVVYSECRIFGRLRPSRSMFHRLNRPHPAIELDSFPLMIEVFARRFGGTGEETAHHHSGCAESDGFSDVTNIADTSVGDGGDAES